MARLARWLGWTLLISGAVVLLYVVYLLWFTGLETQRSQNRLAEGFPGMAVIVPDTSAPGGSAQARTAADPAPDEDPEADAVPPEEPIDAGEAYAAMWFERDGRKIVHEDVLYVVGDVTIEALRAGPGHYPDSDRPGGPGNFAVAGHRTTYGSPFWSLDALVEGDTIHVVDRDGAEWVYTYTDRRIVTPQDGWVVGADPLGSGEPTITLTTCHPRGSAAQRLIAFGVLTGDPVEEENP